MTTSSPIQSPTRKRSRTSPAHVSLSNVHTTSIPGSKCPYMNTINRASLDFDLEPVCVVSLQRHNVYACLTCGKFLHGKAPSTYAYSHSIDQDHHLFLNLITHQVYCLPEGYRVIDSVFDQIIAVLHPSFTSHIIQSLDSQPLKFRVLDGTIRHRGAVGLDNLHSTDYANVVFQILLSIPPIRNFLLEQSNLISNVAIQAIGSMGFQADFKQLLAQLCRKIWASNAFRSYISPHQLMQLITRESRNRFGILKQADPIDFIAWLLNSLQVRKSFQGEPSVKTFSNLLKKNLRGKMLISVTEENGAQKQIETPFWYLPLELPPKPLFKDADERNLVAQTSLGKLLEKFDGNTSHHIVKTGERRKYKLVNLPQYLLLLIKRFTKSKFGVEKNPCIVHLPEDYLDLSDMYEGIEEVRYSLIGAILHRGNEQDGKYRVALYHKSSQSWFDVEEKTVKSTLFQLVSLADSYILLYEKITS